MLKYKPHISSLCLYAIVSSLSVKLGTAYHSNTQYWHHRQGWKYSFFIRFVSELVEMARTKN